MDTLQRRALEKQKRLEEQQYQETLESYQLVLEYLLDEGFASTEDSADKIILNMSEKWFSSILDERYKGKHGQSSDEYKDDRSPGGKMVSGDSKQSGAEYTHGRRVKAANPGSQPDEGGKTKPKSQGKMDRGTRADLEYRKANLKKEEAELVDENRRAARSAGGYKDDSKKQPDPSKDGFTGIGKMSIKDIMALNKKIESRKDKKEEFSLEEGREEDAKKSLEAVKKRQGVLDAHEKKTGKKLDITKTPEYKSHKQNFPGAKRTGKKVKGAKETPQETQNRRINKTVDRIVKKGYTSKEKKEVQSMAKHASRYD